MPNSLKQVLTQSVLKILSPPFEWLYIPPGRTLIHYAPYSEATVYASNVNEFLISKYPVTVDQYMAYVRESEKVPQSDYWQKPVFSRANHPMIDIRWHEAIGFCEWLSEKLRWPITLPSDAEWQRAAQGESENLYPWGNEWDQSKCNTEEAGLGFTTAVTKYSEGSSPFGVMDMMGNVFEWCSTNPKTGDVNTDIEAHLLSDPAYLMNTERIFKGSSFNNSGKASNVIKYGMTPIFYPYFTGIRLITRLVR